MDISRYLTDELRLPRPRRSPLRPHRLDVPASARDDLRRRLSGEPGELARAWRAFDWSAWQARLDEWPGFVTEIDGRDVPFLHVRSPELDALPLLLLPGRPGGLVDLIEVLAPLSDPRAHAADPRRAFHLVVLSPPGAAFSDRSRAEEWDAAQLAEAAAALMTRLGYREMGVYGAELSVDAACQLGDRHLDRVVGVHLGPPRWIPPYDAVPLSLAGLLARHGADFAAETDPVRQQRFLARLSLLWFTGQAGAASLADDPEFSDPVELINELRDFFHR